MPKKKGSGDANKAVEYLEDHLADFKAMLAEMVRIPSVSAEGFPPKEVERSAESVAAAMKKTGLDRVKILKLPNVHPYAYGEWKGAPGRPTVLLYAHHDVQPAGRVEKWHTPPWEATERNGRLYGRGTADDKAGIVTHLAAIRSYLETGGGLPLNVKLLIEGEEEIGSENLTLLLEKEKERLQADFIVLTDTANIDAGIPSLTYMLRGIVTVDVEVQSLDHPLHSGMWGGPIPDPVQALTNILGGLVKSNGKLDVPGLYDQVRKLTKKEKDRIRKLPFSARGFHRQAGLLPGVKLAGEKGFSAYEQLWTRPNMTVIAFEARPLKGSSNQIIESARARLSIRTVPDMRSKDVGRLFVKRLTKNPPWGVKVKAKMTGASPWWRTEPEGPAFDAALKAMKRGFGRPPALIGAGGSIGFVQPFADVLGGVPALLLGLEDPICNAHSENESLNLHDWHKGMRTAVFLYDELAKVTE
jgi:acetylornithine deacetylase/succinyl-diaminopimelate desuccinylase-like protein